MASPLRVSALGLQRNLPDQWTSGPSAAAPFLFCPARSPAKKSLPKWSGKAGQLMLASTVVMLGYDDADHLTAAQKIQEGPKRKPIWEAEIRS
jgi:hypothetical protein